MTKAYKRYHVWSHSTAACTALINGLIFILCRLLFGSALAPLDFCLILESVFDLENDLIQNPYWNLDEIKDLLNGLIPEKEEPRHNLPFMPAFPLDVEIPGQANAKVNDYINDAHMTAIDDSMIFKHANAAFLLAPNLMFCRFGESKPIEREDILQQTKMEGEGTPSELKIFLGWLMDLHLFLASLPQYKSNAWMKEITDLLGGKIAFSSNNVESLIGKLNNAGLIIPSSWHFLNQIRWWFWRNRGWKDMQKDIPQGVRNKLILCMPVGPCKLPQVLGECDNALDYSAIYATNVVLPEPVGSYQYSGMDVQVILPS
eukprot:2054545-Ditylum_brightwellii.AAC.1